LSDRGLLREGLAADITVFDPQHVRDNTTPQASDRFPDGITHVFINGVCAFKDGEPLPGVRAGAVIRR
jgi:N-acyl-D-aspartate/D-glutamate deacylase